MDTSWQPEPSSEPVNPYHCTICGTYTNGDGQLKQHLGGKQHRRAVVRWQDQGKPVPPHLLPILPGQKPVSQHTLATVLHHTQATAIAARHAALWTPLQEDTTAPAGAHQPSVLPLITAATPAPGNQHVTPGNQHSAPGNQHTAPGNQHTAPGNQHTAPGNQHTAPGNQHTAPSNQQATPGNQHTVPGNQHVTPGNQHAAPGNQHAAPGDQTVTMPTSEQQPGDHPAVGTMETRDTQHADVTHDMDDLDADLDDDLEDEAEIPSLLTGELLESYKRMKQSSRSAHVLARKEARIQAHLARMAEQTEAAKLKKQKVHIKCDLCKCTFDNQQIADTHFSGKKHAKNLFKGLKCELCNMQFHSPAIAISHFEGRHHKKQALIKSGAMSCALCGLKFQSVDVANQHKNGKRHADMVALLEFQKTGVRAKKETWKCDDCCVIFYREDDFTKHKGTRLHEKYASMSTNCGATTSSAVVVGRMYGWPYCSYCNVSLPSAHMLYKHTKSQSHEEQVRGLVHIILTSNPTYQTDTAQPEYQQQTRMMAV